MHFVRGHAQLITSIENEGARLHVAVDSVDNAEELPALLLWPNGSASLRVWDHLVPRLRHRFRMIRVDIRGVGQSLAAPAPDDDDSQFDFEVYARDARAVLDALDIETCHVWSQSWGSRPAIVFCARYAERVFSAALYAANLDPPDVPKQREGSKLAAERQQAAGIEVPPAPDGMHDHANPDTVPRAMQALRRFELASVIDDLTMPVLIGTGSLDPNLVSSRTIAKRLPNASLSVLQDVGHNGILERPDVALEEFLRFHDDIGTPAGRES